MVWRSFQPLRVLWIALAATALIGCTTASRPELSGAYSYSSSLAPAGAANSTPANSALAPAAEPSAAPVRLASHRNAIAEEPEPVSEPAERARDMPTADAAGFGMPIDFATALQLTAGQNPRVAYAEERIREAFAQLRSARVMWVPTLHAGGNYNKHEGRIQDVAGRMIETSRGSIYTGLGAQAVGAGSPAVPGLVMNFHMRDAIFQPRIARPVVAQRQHASQAMLNDMLLETSLAYTQLLESLQLQAVVQETLDNARQLAQLTSEFARTGQGLQSDADRAQTELSLREIELRRAAEDVRVASVRLARLLSLDQAESLAPQEPALVPIEMVAPDAEPAELIAFGLSNRPELAESQCLVAEAVERLQRERVAPLVPSVVLGMSYGGNGGGLGSDIRFFGDRMDFDAVAYWEVRNLGLGEHAARDQAGSRVSQARWQQVQVLDQVASEVAEAHAQVTARREQIELAETAIQTASDSLRRNTQRIREGQGLPIETLQAIQALDQARRVYVRAVGDYNRAQFRLHRALGWPIYEA